MNDGMLPINVGMHIGGALKAIGMHYVGATVVVAEMVQNALDEGAKNILIIVDVPQSRVIILDDGNGASYKQLAEKFQNFCQSMKIGRGDTIGRFGIGLTSALMLGERFSLITKPKTKAEHPLLTYQMTRGMWDERVPRIEPMPTRPDPNFRHTTAAIIEDVDASALRELEKQEKVVGFILDRYQRPIAKRGVRVEIEVIGADNARKRVEAKPREFSGIAQEPVVIPTSFGSVTFEMFLNVRRIDNPRLLVHHTQNASLALRGLTDLWEEIKSVLGKGFLQGIISLEFATLHHDRARFLPGKEYEAFCGAVRLYVRDYAKPLVDKVFEEGEIARNNEIIRSALKTIEGAMGKLKQHNLLPAHIGGLVSRRHYGADGAPETSEEYRRNPKERRESTGKRAGDRGEAQKEQERKLHGSTADATGDRRRVVQGQKGITVRQVEPEPEDGLDWRMRLADGVFELNITHRDWRTVSGRAATDNGQSAQRYCIMQILFTLIGERCPAQERGLVEKTVEMFMEYWNIIPV